MRVVSFNFNNLLAKRSSPNASWRRRVHNMITILRVISPEILVAQEIMSVSDLRFLAQQLGMHYRSDAWHAGGMCVLSKNPIVRVVKQNIPNSYFNSLLLVKTYGVWFASIHLFSEEYKHCEDERYRETRWLLNRIQAITKTQPAILAGDWNSTTQDAVQECPLETGTCKRLSCDKESLPATILQKNRWLDAHAGSKISTWIPVSTGVERIDRLYYKGLKRTHGEIVGPERLPKRIRWPTGPDHRLIFADFAIHEDGS
jgi:endonuclease/exonuclease/phosphatase family metal-dependent hydrolase